MAALPPDGTARYFLDYAFDTGQQRSLQVRFASPALVTDVGDWLEALFTAGKALFDPSLVAIGARHAALGSNVTLPTTAPTLPAMTGGSQSAYQQPTFLAFQGRDSVTGVKCRLSLYGFSNGVVADYRYQRGDNSNVDAMLDVMQTPIPGIALSIAGNPVQWYDYANCGFNSFHERKAR